MQHDVTPLWDFYYRSHLGQVTKRSLQLSLRSFWPRTKGMRVAGYGFAAPVLRPFLREAVRTVCLMPESQGVAVWPHDGPNLSVLVDEEHWPLTTGSMDRIILAHALESARHLDTLLEEVSRVMTPDGRLLLVVANRSGIWARREGNPFGIGRPFSYGQIEELLQRHDLAPIRSAGALYMPPTERRFWLKGAMAIERLGRRIDAQRFAGALIVEAERRVFVMPKGKTAETGLLEPIRNIVKPIPAPEPVRQGRTRS